MSKWDEADRVWMPRRAADLAYTLAMAHIGDGDELGSLANEFVHFSQLHYFGEHAEPRYRYDPETRGWWAPGSSPDDGF